MQRKAIVDFCNGRLLFAQTMNKSGRTKARLLRTTSERPAEKPLYINQLCLPEPSAAPQPTTPLAVHSVLATLSPAASPRTDVADADGSGSGSSPDVKKSGGGGGGGIESFLSPRTMRKPSRSDGSKSDEAGVTRSLPCSPRLIEALKNVEASTKPQRRHSLFAPQNTTKISASAVFDPDDNLVDPVIRVRSHTSIGELRRALQRTTTTEVEMITQKTLRPLEHNKTSSYEEESSSSSSTSASASASSTSSTSSCDPLPQAQAQAQAQAQGSGPEDGIPLSASAKSPSPNSSMRKLRRLSQQFMPKTYTLIEYTDDALGLCGWRRFVVPNDEIDDSMREYLERAVQSDAKDPLRVCECKQTKCEHLEPDLLAKVMAVFITDAAFIPGNKAVAAAIDAVLRKEKVANPVSKIARGCLGKFAVSGPAKTDLKKTPCTFFYRYKIFY